MMGGAPGGSAGPAAGLPPNGPAAGGHIHQPPRRTGAIKLQNIPLLNNSVDRE